MQGVHLMADLQGCPADEALFGDPAALRARCRQEVQRCGLTPVNDVFHRFGGAGGVTGVVLLAESHLAVHTWPELAAVTIDAYVCNVSGDNGARAEALLAALEAAFRPQRVQRHRVLRGRLGSA